MFKPREPHEHEKSALADWLADETGEWPYTDEAQMIVNEAAIAVIDNYITDIPDCTGEVMMVVWNGRPELYQVFICRGDQFVCVDQDPRV